MCFLPALCWQVHSVPWKMHSVLLFCFCYLIVLSGFTSVILALYFSRLMLWHPSNCMIKTKGRFIITIESYRYWDNNYEDKMISRPSYYYDGDPIPEEMVFILEMGSVLSAENNIYVSSLSICIYALIARFMLPTWGPFGANRTQVGPMLAPWTLLSGCICISAFVCMCLLKY